MRFQKEEISRDVEEIGSRDARRSVSISPPRFTERRVTRPRWPWYARDSGGGFAEHASSSFQRIRFPLPSFPSFPLPWLSHRGWLEAALWIPCPGTTWYHTCLSADRSLSPLSPSSCPYKSCREIAFSSRRVIKAATFHVTSYLDLRRRLFLASGDRLNI